MENLNDKTKALPYFTTEDNMKKLIEATKLKEGMEESIKSFFGKGRYLQTKRTLRNFNIITGDMKLTETGRRIATSPKKEAEWEWFKIVMDYPPYEEFIQFFRINNKTGKDSIELEEIRNFWSDRDYGLSDSNRSDALITFAHFIVMAGIGEFKKGRRKNPSRIIILRSKLEEKLNLISKANKRMKNNNMNRIERGKRKQNKNNEIVEESKTIEKDQISKEDTIEVSIAGSKAQIYISENTPKEKAKLMKDMINMIFKEKIGV